MKNKFLILSLLITLIACNGKSKSKAVSTNPVQKGTENNQNDFINQQSQSGILEVSEKMQKQEKLTDPDYNCICDFLFNNTDESIGEEIGYNLFNYLKNNQLNNNSFLSYLNKKEFSLKEKILTGLIQIMCIDIGEENYTYDTFIKDFEMFSNSISAKNAFDECMNNQ